CNGAFLFLLYSGNDGRCRLGHIRESHFIFLSAHEGNKNVDLVGQFVSLFSYRLLLHPLKRYPGPLLAKLTDAYAGFYAGTMSIHLQNAPGPFEVWPCPTPWPQQAHLQLYTSRVYGVFNVVDKTLHRFKRRLIGKALSDHSMKIFEPTMLEQIRTFLQALRITSSSTSSIAPASVGPIPLNMTPLVKRLTFDIVGLLAFGNNLKTQTEPTHRPLVDAQTAGNHRSNMFLQFPFLYKIKIFPLLELFARDQVVAYYNSIEKMIAARVAEPKHVRHDLYSLIVDEMNPNGEYLKGSEIWAEGAFFLPAGADTISGCLCAALFYLSRYPRVYTRLAQEICSSFASGETIRGGPEMAACKYLRATIDETLRISPPAPGTLWRELSDPVEKQGPPPGDYFPNPYEFIPERWLDEGYGFHAVEKATVYDAFVPFSAGSRGCAGKAMAYAQCSLVLASILWYFDFETAPGEQGRLGGGSPEMGSGRERENEFQTYDTASSAHDGPMLVFSPRADLM
ncbi:cytochrome p450 family protein, partial [Apiospora rasikravindrae]